MKVSVGGIMLVMIEIRLLEHELLVHYSKPSKIKLPVYNSLFKPHIEYGIVAGGSSADQGIKRTCSLQKCSVRYISEARNKSHTNNLFAEHYF